MDRKTAIEIESGLLARQDLTLITITHNREQQLLNRYDEVIYLKQGRMVSS